MAGSSASVLICGAGIAGVSAAFHLAVKQGVRDVVLVDERAPLSLTSDKSTECYRNWWPGPGDAMVRLMNRSIDILEELAHESGNVFHLNRRGYLYATADPARVEEMRRAGLESADLGAGPLRVHPGDSSYEPLAEQGFENQPTGSDLILDRAMIREHFPYLADRTIAVLHARRCGWLSAQQLGMYMLERAREHGVRFIDGRVVGMSARKGKVESVQLADGTWLTAENVVIAAGPFSGQVAAMLGIDLPVFNELHAKVAYRDDLGAFPRSAPLLIWTDPQRLPWTDEERAVFAESPETAPLLREFPAGVHARPEGDFILALWTYHTEKVEPVLPTQFDPHHPEILLRGLATMLPALQVYFGKTPRPVMDGGYYNKTAENRPLVGPLPVHGAYIVDALSGYGIMAACAAGELLAAHVTRGPLPPYALAFALERYRDPVYRQLLETWTATGQL